MAEPTIVDCRAGSAGTSEGSALRGRILLTGATGFVGQAVLERLLADYPDTHVTVLLRPTGPRTGGRRLAELLGGAVFGPWRARVGDAHVAATVADRVAVAEGGLTDLPALLEGQAPFDVVLHCAGDVTFRGPLDESMATNVSGAAALYTALAPMGGQTHVVHVSTAYVWTDRVGIGAERRVPHGLDWRAECEHAQRMRRALEDQSSPAQETTEDGGGAHVGRTKAGRDRRVRQALADAGHAHAREYGWTDVYTYSKALGERVAEDLWRASPLTILRPTIIESALERPYPGWLDGFKVADPLFAAYAKGRLPGFPGRPDSVIDIIPVDLVVNAALAAARRPPVPGRPRYLHIGTGVSNPLKLDDLRTYVQEFVARNPWLDRDGRPVQPPRWRFAEPADMHRRLERTTGAVDRAARLVAALPRGATLKLRSRLAVAARQLQTTREFVRLYEPYSCSATRYDDLCLRALDSGRDRAEQVAEPLDTTSWQWSHYWAQIHLPALMDLMLAQAGRPLPGPGPAPRRPVEAQIDASAVLAG